MSTTTTNTTMTAISALLKRQIQASNKLEEAIRRSANTQEMFEMMADTHRAVVNLSRLGEEYARLNLPGVVHDCLEDVTEQRRVYNAAKQHLHRQLARINKSVEEEARELFYANSLAFTL